MTNAIRIFYPCSIDNSMQPATFFRAEGDEPRPLVVALHTWSTDHTQPCENYLKWCAAKNWHMIFPAFRGPNCTPDGCGSEKVVADIVDAVAFVRQSASVDAERIYLVGGSGGGHCALLVAGRKPELWAAVSSWCPISDLAAWHRECLHNGNPVYSEHIERACGGNPSNSQAAADEAWQRSPLKWLANAANLPVDINTGIHDGHSGSVPVTHAIRAFNLLAKPEDRISEEDMKYIADSEHIPNHFPPAEPDPSYGANTVLFRRCSNNARLTIFEGGHDLIPAPALRWLEKQRYQKAPEWSVGQAPASGTANTGLGH